MRGKSTVQVGYDGIRYMNMNMKIPRHEMTRRSSRYTLFCIFFLNKWSYRRSWLASIEKRADYNDFGEYGLVAYTSIDMHAACIFCIAHAHSKNDTVLSLAMIHLLPYGVCRYASHNHNYNEKMHATAAVLSTD